jgi:predicted nuclease of predicted toxin-antitoxin system
LDEHLSPAIAEQLQLRGIEVVTARDLNALGDSDTSHLTRAVAMRCVLVTADADFLVMASEGIEHPGIIYGKQNKHTIGDWVTKLELICTVYNADDLKDHVEYL